MTNPKPKPNTLSDPLYRTLLVALVLFNIALIIYILVTSFGAAHAPVSQALTSDSASDPQDVMLLKAQVEALNSYHTDTLTTLWGALAAVATVVGVVALGGAIQSARVYERDKNIMYEQLRQDFTKDLQSQATELRYELNQTKTDITSSAGVALSASKVAYDAQFAAKQQEIEAIALKEVRDVKQQLDNITNDALQAQQDILDLKREAANDHLDNMLALNYATEKLKITIIRTKRQSMNHYYIGDTLEQIRELLQSERTTFLQTSDAADLDAELNEVPPTYAPLVAAIRELIPLAVKR